jgi:hypothetical protein
MRSWWTAGYAPRLDTFMGPETPNPISVKVLRGNCSLQAVLSDALGANQDQLQLMPSQRSPAGDSPICQCGGDVSHLSTDGQRAEVAFQVYN